MEKMRLGRTGITAGRTAFGALPLQRLGRDEAVRIIRRAAEGGVDFYDTARGYTDSEEKLGLALSGVRKSVTIATKSHAGSKELLLEHMGQSMKMLQTDYIDIYQLHNPARVPVAGDELYEALAQCKRSGAVRHIGVTCHRLDNAVLAVESGLYDTVQFPLSCLSDEGDLRLAALCAAHDVGLIAMKALSGGLVSSAAAAFAFLRRYENILPIWGIQRYEELDEFLALEASPPALEGALLEVVERDRRELSGAFCRGCGYCQPCPQGIPIFMAARMSLALGRLPWQQFVTPEWQEAMARVEQCTHCGHCKKHCPYGLDTPELLKTNLKYYKEFLLEHEER